VRQDLVDQRGRMGLDAEQDVGEVGDGVHAVRLAGGHERVQPGQVLAGRVVANEQEILSFMRSSA
jgi:hypothetical protein